MLPSPTTSSPFSESVFDGFGYSIPTTIAELILHHCLVDKSCCGTSWTNGSSNRPSAKTVESVAALCLCLVNSSWNAFTIPVLFKKIHLVSTKQAVALLQTLRTNPDRSRLINSLTITIPSLPSVEDPEIHQYHSTLRKLFKRHLPALRHLHLYTSGFINAMIYLKDGLRRKISLKSLSILAHGYCEAMSTSYIWSILREFPELEEFWFEFRALDGVKAETERRIPKDLCLPNMRRLGISGAVISDESVEALCCMCPNLEIMEIDNENRFLVI